MSGQRYTRMETNQLISIVNQLPGFYVSVTLAGNGLSETLERVVHNLEKIHILRKNL